MNNVKIVAYTIDDEKVYAHKEMKSDKEYIDDPINRQKVILVKGEKKIDHFRYHKSVPEDKRIYSNESLEHEKCKRDIYDEICKYNELDPLFFGIEYYFKDFKRIADVGGFNKKSHLRLAIEVVHKHTDFNDYKKKVTDYHEHGIYDFWVFTDACFDFEKGYGYFHDIMEDLQKRFGVLYYWDSENKTLCSLKMTKPHSETLYHYDKLPCFISLDFDSLAYAEADYQHTICNEKYYREEWYLCNLDAAVIEMENRCDEKRQEYDVKVAELEQLKEGIQKIDDEIRYAGLDTFCFPVGRTVPAYISSDEVKNKYGKETFVIKVNGEEYYAQTHVDLIKKLQNVKGLWVDITRKTGQPEKDSNGIYSPIEYLVEICE